MICKAAWLLLISMTLLLTHCRLPIPISSDPGAGPEHAKQAEPMENTDGAVYPRIVADPLERESELAMFNPGQSRTIQLQNGTSITASTGIDHLEIVCTLPDGKRKQYLQKEGPEMNYSIHPVGQYVLIVSGVNAGPGNTGTLLDPATGERFELKVTFDFGDGKTEPVHMSLYSMSLIEASPGIFLLAGTGNTSMLRLDVTANPPEQTEIPFREVPLVSEFGAFIEDGTIYYRYREPDSEDPSWKKWKLKDF